MRHTLPLLILAAGCASGTLSYREAPDSSAPASAAGVDAVSARLVSASESDWRKVIDTGPQQFDDEGMPVVARPGGPAPGAKKTKRFGFGLGFLAEANVQDSMGDVSFKDDGPVVCFYMRLGSKRLALETGYEWLSVLAESNSIGQISKSNLHMMRADGTYFLSGPETPVRLYGQAGARFIIEDATIYTSYDEEKFTNSAMGWGLTVGILTNQFDLKIEHFEVSGSDSGVSFTAFTAAYRF